MCKSAKVRDIQTGLNLDLVLNTRTRDLMAETRDLRMPLPVSGFHLMRLNRHNDNWP